MLFLDVLGKGCCQHELAAVGAVDPGEGVLRRPRPPRVGQRHVARPQVPGGGGGVGGGGGGGGVEGGGGW